MSSSGLTLLLTVSFVLFARVTSYVVTWSDNDYKFNCVQVCSEYLKGDTYSCFSASGYGLAAGRLIVRILPNFEWRYYGIHEVQYENDYCQHIMVADEFYSSGNKTACHGAHVRSIMNGDKGTRSSEATSQTDMEKMVRYLSDVTRLAQDIQKDDMIVDERGSKRGNITSDKEGHLSDEKVKRFIPLIAGLIGLIGSILGLVGSHKHRNNIFEDISNIIMTPAPILDTENIATRHLRRSHHEKQRDHHSATDDPTSDAICYWVSKNMCRKGQILVCDHDVCCWETPETDPCEQILNDKGMNIYRENIHTIIQALGLLQNF